MKTIKNFMTLLTPRSAPPMQISQADSFARDRADDTSSENGRYSVAQWFVPIGRHSGNGAGLGNMANDISGANELRTFLRPAPPTSFVERARLSNVWGERNGWQAAQRGRASAKINLEAYWQPSHHRSGWRYALDSLRSLHSPQGVLFDGFIEKKFVWGADAGERHNGWTPYTKPWVGVLHNPPGIPDWFNLNGQSPDDILRTSHWQQSMASCCGIFTLSNYLKTWLEQRVPVRVCSLFHPTEIPEQQFSLEGYRRNKEKKIVQVGWWLRKFQSLYRLRVKGFRKLLLDLGQSWIDNIRQVELTMAEGYDLNSVELSPYLDNEQYDSLLSKNLVFLHLYDSSANNALIECIARSTPVLVNPLPAVVEYLGHDYPFYFQTLEEAAGKAEDESLVRAAHEYLKDKPLRERLTGANFLRSLVESEIYQQLPDPQPMYWHSRHGR